MDSYLNNSSLLMRAGFLVVLVVLFQWFVARAPNTPKETKRRFQHALTGHALVQISYVLPKSLSLALLLIASLGMYLAKTFFFEKFLEAFGGLLRPSESSGEVLPGAFYFLVGTAITVSGLVTDDLRIARYSVECLALADPMASWVGSSVSSPRFTVTRNKNNGTTNTGGGGGVRTSSLAGCLACFGTALLVGWWMLVASVEHSNENDERNTTGDSGSSRFTTATLVAGAIACTIAEGLPFGNDNLNIPVITAFVVDRFAAASSTVR